ncbi:hypothetical protein [Intestinimonas timonensis]|uniref:hypothetical protein n=1 Tax=Intestinimonas timonensis TaxID=1689270 RepID=UPI003A937D36
MIHLQLLIAVGYANVIQYSAAPQFIDAVIILPGMCHLHQLESVRLMLKVDAVHTIHTPRSGNAGAFQNRGAVLLVALHNVPINGGIGNAGHFQIEQRSVDSLICGFRLAWEMANELNHYMEERPEPENDLGPDALA